MLSPLSSTQRRLRAVATALCVLHFAWPVLAAAPAPDAREQYLKAPTAPPKFLPEQRLELFTRTVEPTLQRELKHKGAANGDGSYSAELIGYVEIIERTA